MLVVSIETWPNQARMVLMSTPARSRWVAVVCLSEWGESAHLQAERSNAARVRVELCKVGQT